MQIPNAHLAVIAPEKLRDYLLNPNHRRGGPKARLLWAFGYRADAWEILERDLRRHHLTAEVSAAKNDPWGIRYEIRAAIPTPCGRPLILESIWQIDTGTEIPRFITMYPR